MKRFVKDKVFLGKRLRWITGVFVVCICMSLVSGSVRTVRAEESAEKTVPAAAETAGQQGTKTVSEGAEKSEEEIMADVNESRNGIVRVESISWDGDSRIYETRSFSGFIVSGNKDANNVYVVTVHDGLTYTPEDEEAIKSSFEEEKNIRISQKIEVIFKGDLRVQASIVGESAQRNLTVLRLDQNISLENILQFAKENASYKERIFFLSYPKSVEKKGAIYNTKNVKVVSGIVLDFYQTDEVEFLHHDIKADVFSAGGPLVNEEGAIVGMLLTSGAKGKGTALSGESLKGFLDTLNAGYEEYEEVVEEDKPPVLNLALGVVILILAVTVIIRQVKGGSASAERSEKVSGGDSKKKKRKNKDSQSGGGAFLEYPAEGRNIPVNKDMFVIGRMQDADLMLTRDGGISRKHACIQIRGNKYYLSDLQSKNHTFLNGQQLVPGEKMKLKNGDHIMIGKEKLIFHK